MNIIPLGDNVFVRRHAAEPSILIPGQNATKNQKGTVVAAGNCTRDLSVGDEVMLPKYGGSEVEFDENLVLVFVKEREVIGKFEK